MKIVQNLAIVTGFAAAGTVSAQTLQFTAFGAGPYNSAGAVGDVDNGSFTFNYAGAPFIVGDIVFQGDLTDNGVGTWGSEAAVSVTNPGGIVGQVALGSGTTFAGTVAIGPNTITGGNALWGNDVVGTWSFEFFETFDDAPGADAIWNNVSFEFYDFMAPPPPPSTFIGVNPNTSVSDEMLPASVLWYSFDVTGGAGAQPWSIDTFGSTNTGGSFGDDDTEIGLFDAAGNLVASNDDADFGAGILTSELTSDTVGALADGTYYIAVGCFNTVYGAGFDATSDSTSSGTSVLNVNFVPAPGSVALLGLGGLAAMRRRR